MNHTVDLRVDHENEQNSVVSLASNSFRKRDLINDRYLQNKIKNKLTGEWPPSRWGFEKTKMAGGGLEEGTSSIYK